MRTKKITLFYHVSPSKIITPEQKAIDRKDEWVKEIQRGIKKNSSRKIKLTYELFNPEVDNMRRFFNGPVIDYYTIQNAEILKGLPERLIHDRYRETLLSSILGYEVQLIDRTEKRRKSTSDFDNTQQWHDFLERLRETEFEPHGYEMPDSEAFWDLEKEHGYEQAQRISIEALQKRIAKKLSTPRE